MSEIHDLLDAVCSGQPANHVTVDDLVRAGRRRHRVLAAGAAAGTATVVAVVAAVLVVGRPGGTALPAGGPTMPGTLATTPPAISSSSPLAGASTATIAVITAGHVLAAGRQVGTYVTYCSQVKPTLTVLSQDNTRVVLQLRIVMPRMGSGPGPGNECGQPGQASPVRPGLLSSGELTAELTVPLGHRRLVDSATGKTIPYTRDDRTAWPTWLPAGWRDATSVHPTDLLTWQQEWQHGTSEQLQLTQTYHASNNLRGPANTMVGSAAARLVHHGDQQTLMWWVKGTSYTLTNAHIGVCLPGLGLTSSQAPMSCPATQTGPLLDKADLLRIARSVHTR
jgi:hypothetical protein